jgi:hypothetical protein
MYQPTGAPQSSVYKAFSEHQQVFNFIRPLRIRSGTVHPIQSFQELNSGSVAQFANVFASL